MNYLFFRAAWLNRVGAGLTITALVFSIIPPLAFFSLPSMVQAATTTTFFTDSFGSSNSNTVTGWEDSDLGADGASIKTIAADRNPGSPTIGFVRLKQKTSSIATTSIATVGHDNIELSFYWRGKGAQAADKLQVEWRLSGETDYITLATKDLDNTTWTLENISLPAAAADTLIDLRFRVAADGNANEAIIDDVKVTGLEIVARGSVAGQKWHDENGNGLKDENEPGVAGWTIALTGPMASSTTTDGNGNYSFNNLTDGDYIVCEEILDLAPPWRQLFPTATTSGATVCDNNTIGWQISLTGGENITGLDFGNRRLARIRIAKETLPDNSQESFSLTGDLASTDLIDGGSVWADVLPGTYASTESERAGWDLTDISCSNENGRGNLETRTATFTVIAGDDLACVFTNTQRGSISFDKFADPDQGQFIFTLNGRTVTEPITIDGSGRGNWNNLLPGEYSLTEQVPATWSGVQEVSCTDGFDPIDPDDFTLNPGAAISCTFNNSEYGVITGRKFEDDNANNLVENGEPGLADWTINLSQLVGDQWVIVASQTTAADGVYSFGNLISSTSTGAYLVCETNQTGWRQSSSLGNAECPDSSRGYLVNLTAGAISRDNNFGNWRTGSIAGYKWHDENGDGDWNQDEPALSGWVIYLDLDGDGELDQNDIQTTTDTAGRYTFFDLSPGSYQIRESNQRGWVATYPTDPAKHSVTILSGQNRDNLNFGNFERAVVAGYKWEDLDQDGSWDENESALAGWTITAATAVASKTSLTNEDGYYEFWFTPSEAGIWMISEEIRTGWQRTYPIESNTHEIVVSPGTWLIGNNFGNWRLPYVFGYKWHDWNNDGVWQTGEGTTTEPGVAGWTMALGRVVETSSTTPTGAIPIEIISLSLTGSDGSFSLPVPAPGQYKVFELRQDNWRPTAPTTSRDSFFDVFYRVETNGTTISSDRFFDVLVEPADLTINQDIHQQPINFGNIHYREIFGGFFAPINGDASSTPTVQVLGDPTVLQIPDAAGLSTLSFPGGTKITRADGGLINLNDLIAETPTESSIAGLGVGEVAAGVLRWGLTDLGLEFNQPVTISIFVGSDLNGQTLNLIRSVDGAGGWTTDGLIPTTCVVADGLCAFTATKASYYVASYTPPVLSTTSDLPGGGGGSGGSRRHNLINGVLIGESADNRGSNESTTTISAAITTASVFNPANLTATTGLTSLDTERLLTISEKTGGNLNPINRLIAALGGLSANRWLWFSLLIIVLLALGYWQWRQQDNNPPQ